MGMTVRIAWHLPSGMGAPYYSGRKEVSTNYGMAEAEERVIRDLRSVYGNHREVVIDEATVLTTW